ncbi:glycosyltransferase [Methylobacterium sp. WSM2598]|uniref:glycosyltransferase n=1 Tax=Methylobacterium sp. WSM2598 TaxID=398261 RepID=UPI0012F67637|nr:glycosyltransferase [Methylobacterium sp. WSM2598]
MQSAQSGSRHGGIGRYSIDLAKAMIATAGDFEFSVLLNNLYPEITESVKAEFQSLLPASSIKTFFSPVGIPYIANNHAITRAAEAARLAFIENMKVDAVHITSLFEGLHDQVVVSIPMKGTGSCVTAVTVYDLIPHYQREVYLRDLRARSHYYDKFNQLPNADCALAISNFSANEFSATFPDFVGPVVNISGGVDKKFRGVEAAYFKNQSVFQRNCINKEYILYTASFDQRKNHAGLIRAFAALEKSLRDKYILVFVGNGWPEIYENLWNIAESCGLGRNSVVFTGRVDDEELVALYNCCKLFVFPSRWEGLGLPPVEAMACGAPVIGSNTTSIAEVIGLNDALFNPDSELDILTSLNRALTDESFIEKLKSHARTHRANFSWAKSARIALDTIRETVERRGSGRSRTVALARAPAIINGVPLLASERRVLDDCARLSALGISAEPRPAKAKLAWISSYQTKCGIASYSERIIANFKDTIRVFAPRLAESECLVSENKLDNVAIVRCWNSGKDDDLRDLRAELDIYEPEAVVIQFNFGFFDLRAIGALIENR